MCVPLRVPLLCISLVYVRVNGVCTACEIQMHTPKHTLTNIHTDTTQAHRYTHAHYTHINTHKRTHTYTHTYIQGVVVVKA